MSDIKNGIITINTHKHNEIIDITDNINKILRTDCVACNIFLLHTTAALATVDIDEGAQIDFANSLDKLLPSIDYEHAYNPYHMPMHILSSILGTSMMLPVRNGNLLLGEWQKLVLVELNGPRIRKLVVTGMK